MKINKQLKSRESCVLALLAQGRSLGEDEIVRILDGLGSDTDARMIANVLTNRLSGKETEEHKKVAQGFRDWAKSLGK
jgi:hypothetical protein